MQGRSKHIFHVANFLSVLLTCVFFGKLSFLILPVINQMSYPAYSVQ